MPAQLTTGAWIATESLLPWASGWRLVAANDDGSWLRFAGQLGQCPTRARLAIAELAEERCVSGVILGLWSLAERRFTSGDNF
jgi:hypothetical protein